MRTCDMNYLYGISNITGLFILVYDDSITLTDKEPHLECESGDWFYVCDEFSEQVMSKVLVLDRPESYELSLIRPQISRSQDDIT